MPKLPRYRPRSSRPQNSGSQESQLCRKCRKESKYRCPKTRLLYCSLPCYKSIQKDLEDGKIKPAEPPKDDKGTFLQGKSPVKGGQDPEVPIDSWAKYDNEEDRVPKERLEFLETSEEVKNLLANPHLRKIINYINTTRNKDRCMEKAMQEPLFVEFADACLNLVESDSSDGEKTPEPKEDSVEVQEFDLLQF